MIEIIGLSHPALVHLPIGIILITIFYEWYKKSDSITLWFMATLSAIMTMIAGLILLKSGRYEGLEMFLHLIMGVLTTIVTALIFLSKWQHYWLFNAQNTLLKWILFGLLLFGGHKGAELTHGKNYLPIPFLESEKESDISFIGRESVVMYDDIIKPILDRKCIKCHETDDERGKLNLQTIEGLLSDKYGDPAVFPGDINESEIYKRISLSPSDKKYMPPSGEDLNYEEKKMIEWWIRSGASFTDNIKEMNPPDHVKATLFAKYGIDFRKKSFYEKKEVAALDPSLLEKLIVAEYNVSTLAANTNFIDVNIKGKSNKFSSDRLNHLVSAKDQITWLDLSNSNLNDEMATVIKNLTNLTKLKIQNTSITDKTIQSISDLENLSVLNIYGTIVSDASIEALISLPNLEKLYIWQSNISSAGIEQLKTSKPGLEVVGKK